MVISVWSEFLTDILIICGNNFFKVLKNAINLRIRKYAKIVFYLTPRDAKTLRHASCGLDTSDRYFDKTHFEALYDFRLKVYTTSGSKVMAQIVVFGDIDLDLWPMFYFFWSHALRMMYWNIQAKFNKNPSRLNGWYAAVKVLKNALCFIMGYLVAMEIRVTLFLLMQFFMLYSIGPINVCTDFEINPYKIDEVRKYAIFIADRYFDKEHVETNQKSLRLPV